MDTSQQFFLITVSLLLALLLDWQIMRWLINRMLRSKKAPGSKPEALHALLIFFLAARRTWLERAPGWMRRGVAWLFQPAAVLETWSQPGSAPALYFSTDQK